MHQVGKLCGRSGVGQGTTEQVGFCSRPTLTACIPAAGWEPHNGRLLAGTVGPARACSSMALTPLSRNPFRAEQVQRYLAGSDAQCAMTVLPTASAIASHLVRVLPYVQHDVKHHRLLCFFGYLSNVSELADRVHGVSAYGHEDTGAATTSLILGLYQQIHGVKEEKLFLSELQAAKTLMLDDGFLLAGYGQQMPGRYAFFLYDGIHKQALAARDPSGEQELYYCLNRDTGMVSFTNSLDDLPPGEDLSQWLEVPPGHYVSGRTPELRQFALTPQQLELRERHESTDIGYGLYPSSDSGDASTSSYLRAGISWDS
eukprot:351965-Chlamydomonas_euryale.AAC.3